MRHGENGMITVAGVRAGMNPAPTVDGSDFITAHPTTPVALIKARKTFVPASLELYVTGGSVVHHWWLCCTSLVAVLYITDGSVEGVSKCKCHFENIAVR